jgi:hypothetical protein
MTLSDLTASIRFRALFEFEFGESAYRQYHALDVVLLADPEIVSQVRMERFTPDALSAKPKSSRRNTAPRAAPSESIYPMN